MMNGRVELDRILVFTAILCLHLTLIIPYPILYGGDTILRLAGFPGIQIAYQLPLLQVLLHLAMRLFSGPQPVWLLMAVLSGLAGLGLFSLAHLLTGDRTAARLAAAFYACHPFVLYYSHVPYQEPLLLACLTWGFYFLSRSASRNHLLLSSLFLGAGCLTRYEAWIAAVVACALQVHRVREGNRRGLPRAVLKAVALYGWAPALWMIWNQGISPSGTYVLSLKFEWDRLYRPYFIAKTILWWTDSSTVLLALLGFAASLAVPVPQRERDGHRFLLLFAVLFFAALLFSAHGIEPDPSRLVTERQAFVPIGILILYAGAGAARAVHSLPHLLSAAPGIRRGISVAALIFLLGLGLYRGVGRVASANKDPELRTDYQVAQFLAEKGAAAIIFARPLPQDQIRDYLRRAERAGGRTGLELARRRLEETDTSPFDYQRVLVFSWLGRKRILPGEALSSVDPSLWTPFLRERGIEFLVVFSDFVPTEELDRRLLSPYAIEQNLAYQALNGFKGARVYRILR